MPGYAQLEKTLKARLQDLTNRVAHIEQDLREPKDDNFSEQAVDRADDVPLDAVEHSTLQEIAAIAETLARMKTGTYGFCVSCGAAISEQRLAVMPTAKECIDCAQG